MIKGKQGISEAGLAEKMLSRATTKWSILSLSLVKLESEISTHFESVILDLIPKPYVCKY